MFRSRRLPLLLAAAGVACMLCTAGLAATSQPLTGTITSIDAGAGSLVVTPKESKTGPVTVATDAATTYKVNGKAATFGDLTAGMSVAVEPATGTAREIRAYTPPPPPPPPPLYGTVASVDAAAGTFVVTLREGKGDVTVATDANTKYTVDKKSGAIGDLKPGMHIVVTPPTGPAKEVMAYTPPPPPPPPPLYGTVASIDAAAGTFVVTRDGKSVTVTTDANTKYTVDKKSGAIGDLKAGMHVAVTPPTGTAKEVMAYTPAPPPPPPSLYGVVGSVDATAGTFVVTRDGKSVTVTTDANTKYTIDKKSGAIGDLKAGMHVAVNPATGTAKEVMAYTPPPPPPPPPLYGVVSSVNATAGTFVVTREGKSVTVTTDANTKYTIDKKSGAIGDLKAGMHVVVKPATGTATEVMAYTPLPPPPKSTTLKTKTK